MATLYRITVTAHVLAALVWLGGIVVFALAAPILREVEDEAVRQRLFERVGDRFRTVGWICIVVLVATGVVQLRLRGWWGETLLFASGFWNEPPGSALAWKLAAVGVILVVQAIHDFHLGPKAGRVVAGTKEARTLRKRAALLARFNVVLAVVLVYFAVRLTRG